jgi:hypothetical protein
MSSTTKAKRISRVRRRGSPQLVAALDAGQISIRTADTLLYLSPDEQVAQLDRRLRAVGERERKSHTVARTIRHYLDDHKDIDLEELRSFIQAALVRAF